GGLALCPRLLWIFSPGPPGRGCHQPRPAELAARRSSLTDLRVTPHPGLAGAGCPSRQRAATSLPGEGLELGNSHVAGLRTGGCAGPPPPPVRRPPPPPAPPPPPP